MVKAELVLGGPERILDCPAVAFDPDQSGTACFGRAPGREGELALGDGAADQQAPRS